MSCDVYKEVSMQYDAKREKAESEIKLKKRTLEDKLPKYKELEKKILEYLVPIRKRRNFKRGKQVKNRHHINKRKSF